MASEERVAFEIPESRRMPLPSRLWGAAALVLSMLGATVPVFLHRRGESVQTMGLAQALLTGGWWCVPILVHAGLAATRLVLLLGGVAMVATAPLTLSGVYTSTSSTAAFGIVFTPVYLVVASFVLVVAEHVMIRLLDP